MPLTEAKRVKYVHYLKFAVGVVLTLVFGTLIELVFLNQHLEKDPAIYLFNILHEQRFPPTEGRFASLVLYLPAIFIRALAGDDFDVVNLVTKTTGLLFTLQHAASLFICILILNKNNKAEWIVFPVLSFTAGSMLAMSRPIGYVHEFTTLFWPIFCYVLTKTGQVSIKSLVLLFFSILSLGLTHEYSIFSLIIILGVLFYRRNIFSIRAYFYLVVLANLIAMLLGVNRIVTMISRYDLSQDYNLNQGSFLRYFDDPLLCMQFALVSAFLILLLNTKFRVFIFGFFILLLSAALIKYGVPETSFTFISSNRVIFPVVVFFMALIACMIYWVPTRFFRLNSGSVWSLVLISACFSLIGIMNIRSEWKENLALFESRMVSESGCSGESFFEGLNSKQTYFMNSFFLPMQYFSILNQGSKQINKILIVPHHKGACDQMFKQGKVSFYELNGEEVTSFSVENGYFDFSKLAP